MIFSSWITDYVFSNVHIVYAVISASILLVYLRNDRNCKETSRAVMAAIDYAVPILAVVAFLYLLVASVLFWDKSLSYYAQMAFGWVLLVYFVIFAFWCGIFQKSLRSNLFATKLRRLVVLGLSASSLSLFAPLPKSLAGLYHKYRFAGAAVLVYCILVISVVFLATPKLAEGPVVYSELLVDAHYTWLVNVVPADGAVWFTRDINITKTGVLGLIAVPIEPSLLTAKDSVSFQVLDNGGYSVASLTSSGSSASVNNLTMHIDRVSSKLILTGNLSAASSVRVSGYVPNPVFIQRPNSMIVPSCVGQLCTFTFNISNPYSNQLRITGLRLVDLADTFPAGCRTVDTAGKDWYDYTTGAKSRDLRREPYISYDLLDSSQTSKRTVPIAVVIQLSPQTTNVFNVTVNCSAT